MSNIRIDVGYTIKDGTEIKFRSPVDCSAITGLIVYYPGADGNTTSKVFALADAHGNNVGDIDHLFAENVVVKVILDVTTSMAFVQNADTNAYLEAQFASKAPAGYGLGEHSVYTDDCHSITENGWYYTDASTLNAPTGMLYGTILAKTRGDAIVLEYTDIDGGIKAQAVRSGGGVWSEWEFENPPMVVGVEYRTAERYRGKPVYIKHTAWAHTEENTTISISYCDEDSIYAYPIFFQPLYSLEDDWAESADLAGIPPFVEKVWAHGSYNSRCQNSVYFTFGSFGVGENGYLDCGSVSAIVKYIKEEW